MAQPPEIPPPTQIPLYITALQAAGTWLVALIALFGPAFWAWIRRPQLFVDLLNADGDLEVETVRWPDAGGGIWNERTREARYYRLRVVNRRQGSTVQDVQIVVDAIERPLPNGQPTLEYRGPIPLVWQHPAAFPTLRSVGTAAVADFVVVTEERTLRLMTTITPNKYAEEYAGRTQLWVTVAARGRERDSPPVRFKITWDGEWDRGASEMKTHLNIDME
jgi:hypothetical protein